MGFWETKTLEEMTREEWESLCDGCARCCLIQLIDDDGGARVTTSVACELLDDTSCRCTNYTRRVIGCVTLTAAKVRKIDWLPDSCAYRLLRDGRALPDWHPLISGDPESVHRAGISMRGKTVSERDVAVEDLGNWIISSDSDAPDEAV
ncbi:MAG: YcgN family cysteine cluster protein [Hyphomicrobiales bacterium]|nr:MAG: YcgN family cysteine cluster protein [Hyphomicrobiales bacterium]